MNYKTIKIELQDVSTQREAVMFHLLENGTITAWDAIKHYGITRLSSIIFFLRKEGYNIVSENEIVTTRFTNSNGEPRTTVIAKYHYIKPIVSTQTEMNFN